MAKAKGRANAKRTPRTEQHKDGSLWAKGYVKGEVMDGPWKWFRKNGTVMRTGAFDNGVQVGEWVTYDGNGNIVKATHMSGKTKQRT